MGYAWINFWGWKMKDVIYVENHYFVTVKENSIKFRNVIDKSEKFYLFEEIEAIIFDHYKSYFSHKLVIKCIENDIAIIFVIKALSINATYFFLWYDSSSSKDSKSVSII